MNKQELRARMKAYRLSLDSAERKILDRAIADRLIELVSPYDTVLCYVSSDIEVDTRYVLSELFKDSGKKILAPKCVKGTNIMHFYPITGFDDLEEGSFSIYEPKDGISMQTDFSDNSCCIVPALCYDSKGYRVGFGKGFYDRFLAEFSGKKIGICYSGCIVDKIEHDDTDIKIDIIITDKGVSYT